MQFEIPYSIGRTAGTIGRTSWSAPISAAPSRSTRGRNQRLSRTRCAVEGGHDAYFVGAWRQQARRVGQLGIRRILGGLRDPRGFAELSNGFLSEGDGLMARPTGQKQVEHFATSDRRTTFPPRRCRASSSAKKITVPVRQRLTSAPAACGGRGAQPRPRPRSADGLEWREHQADGSPTSPTRRDGRNRDRRSAARLARQGRAGLVRSVVQTPPLYIQEKIHPKAIIDDLKRRRSDARAEARADDPRSVRGFQRCADRGRRARVLPARQQLVEPDDPRRRLPVMASLAEREGAQGQGPVHLHRPALRHPLQLELAGLDA